MGRCLQDGIGNDIVPKGTILGLQDGDFEVTPRCGKMWIELGMIGKRRKLPGMCFLKDVDRGDWICIFNLARVFEPPQIPPLRICNKFPISVGKCRKRSGDGKSLLFTASTQWPDATPGFISGNAGCVDGNIVNMLFLVGSKHALEHSVGFTNSNEASPSFDACLVMKGRASVAQVSNPLRVVSAA